MDKLLYEYQNEWYEKERKFYRLMDAAVERVGLGNMTLREFLDIGFNNSALLKKDDPKWYFDTGYRLEDKYAKKNGKYFSTLTEEMLNVKVIGAEEPYEDSDGYYCLDIYCVNPKDYELFDKALEKNDYELC